jgi:hypothetical protein
MANRPLFIALIIVIVVAFGGLFDFAVNNGKAFGGVTVNGVDVGGLTEDEIKAKLDDSFGKNVKESKVMLRGVGFESFGKWGRGGKHRRVVLRGGRNRTACI